MDEINQNGSISKSKGRTNGFCLVIGWIAAVIFVVRYPFIFGVVGVIMGIVVSKNGSRAGLPLIVASIVLMAAGLIFSDVIYNYLVRALGM